MVGLLDRLRQGKFLVADGAMGTMLMQKGLLPGDCPERINLENPELLEEISREYIEAGAEIIQTNTFGASPLKLKLYDLDDRTEEININAVRAARKASNRKAFVAASCGPCGQLLKPYGDFSPEVVQAQFERQIKALVSEGIDLLCIETMTDLNEAILAIAAAKSVSPKLPVCAMMTFDETPRGFFTIMGVSVEQAAIGLAKDGADIIGSNCGNGIEKMIEIAKELKTYTNLPIMIRPNAGLPALEGEALIWPDSPERMAERCDALLTLGVNIIGGCCGTTPTHIAEMKKRSIEFRKNSRDWKSTRKDNF
jgi:5-methyltetrahydrofolate--homocysteine methyltransferase